MAGSSSIMLFEELSPHHSLYIPIWYYSSFFTYERQNKNNMVKARGEGPEVC
jgi:hypothetical protein